MKVCQLTEVVLPVLIELWHNAATGDVLDDVDHDGEVGVLVVHYGVRVHLFHQVSNDVNDDIFGDGVVTVNLENHDVTCCIGLKGEKGFVKRIFNTVTI